MDERFTYDELIYRGRVADFHQVGVRMPGGRVVRRDFVHYGGAAVILPVLDDGSIVLIRNRRFAVNEHLLELPAGMLNDGEDPLAAAARELTEETGYTAGRIEPLGTFFTSPGSSDENMHAFLAQDLSNGPQALEDYEQITVEVHSDAAVRERVREGTLHDGKSIGALCLYWLRKGGI